MKEAESRKAVESVSFFSPLICSPISAMFGHAWTVVLLSLSLSFSLYVTLKSNLCPSESLYLSPYPHLSSYIHIMCQPVCFSFTSSANEMHREDRSPGRTDNPCALERQPCRQLAMAGSSGQTESWETSAVTTPRLPQLNSPQIRHMCKPPL